MQIAIHISEQDLGESRERAAKARRRLSADDWVARDLAEQVAGSLITNGRVCSAVASELRPSILARLQEEEQGPIVIWV